MIDWKTIQRILNSQFGALYRAQENKQTILGIETLHFYNSR